MSLYQSATLNLRKMLFISNTNIFSFCSGGELHGAQCGLQQAGAGGGRSQRAQRALPRGGGVRAEGEEEEGQAHHFHRGVLRPHTQDERGYLR